MGAKRKTKKGSNKRITYFSISLDMTFLYLIFILFESVSNNGKQYTCAICSRHGRICNFIKKILIQSFWVHKIA